MTLNRYNSTMGRCTHFSHLGRCAHYQWLLLYLKIKGFIWHVVNIQHMLADWPAALPPAAGIFAAGIWPWRRPVATAAPLSPQLQLFWGRKISELWLSRLTFLQVTEALSWRCSLPVTQHGCVACERLLCYYRGLSWKAVGAGFPAVPAVVLEHVEGGVGEEGGAGHGLVARIFLWESQLLHHDLTVAQQLIQTQLPAAEKHENSV